MYVYAEEGKYIRDVRAFHPINVTTKIPALFACMKRETDSMTRIDK